MSDLQTSVVRIGRTMQFNEFTEESDMIFSKADNLIIHTFSPSSSAKKLCDGGPDTVMKSFILFYA